MNIAGFDIIRTEESLEFRPTKLDFLAWKYFRHLCVGMLLFSVFEDIFRFHEPPLKLLLSNGFYLLMTLTAFLTFDPKGYPKPFIINRTTETITHNEKSIPFDDLIHFTVEAATFRDKVVMVTKTEKIDLTSGLSTKKAEKLRDTLVEAIPFALPKPEFFQSKVGAH